MESFVAWAARLSLDASIKKERMSTDSFAKVSVLAKRLKSDWKSKPNSNQLFVTKLTHAKISECDYHLECDWQSNLN